MDKSVTKSHVAKKRRAMRIRKNVRGSAEKPRMCVVKTNKHIQVQLIDDDRGMTLAAFSTNSKGMRKAKAKRNKETAKALGEQIAAAAKKLGVAQVVFDRGPFKYHGILAELATAARTNGLQF